MTKIKIFGWLLLLAACMPLATNQGPVTQPSSSRATTQLPTSPTPSAKVFSSPHRTLPTVFPESVALPSAISTPMPRPLETPFSERGITITPLAGNGMRGNQDGAALEAQFNGVGQVCQDSKGNLYILDRFAVRLLSTDGRISSLAGTGESGFKDDIGVQAQFGSLMACAVDQDDFVYVLDLNNGRIRKITAHGIVSTWSGSGRSDLVDGPPEKASLFRAYGMVLDRRKQEFFVLDAYGLRRVSLSTGNVLTLYNATVRAKNLHAGSNNTLIDGSLQDVALLGSPSNTLLLGIDSLSSKIYIYDSENYAVRILSENNVTTLAGGATHQAYRDDIALNARFNSVSQITFDSERNVLYILDNLPEHQFIRVLEPSGLVRTLLLPGQTQERNLFFRQIGSIFIQDKNHLLVSALPRSTSQSNENEVPRLYMVTLPDTLPLISRRE
ncbi:MAG: hypothetical protein IV090_03460 [Candidatus Sericytochromatia bacterium]|nr:hypothetical protein [Candidatus Sericytochromatia bacterium]